MHGFGYATAEARPRRGKKRQTSGVIQSTAGAVPAHRPKYDTGFVGRLAMSVLGRLGGLRHAVVRFRRGPCPVELLDRL